MNETLKTIDNDNNSPEPHDASPAEQATARWDRIHRYTDAALKNPDEFESNLSLVTASLLGIAFRQQQLLECATERCADSPKKLERQRVALDDFLRVTKQIERYMQLELRSRESRSET